MAFDLDDTWVTLLVTFPSALVIPFAIFFIPTARFLAEIDFVVRIIFDMTGFRALMAAIETSVTRSWGESCFGIIGTGDFDLVAAIG